MIYLDHNATTPVDERVAKVMDRFFQADFGNPSSGYQYGREAKTALEYARKQAADAVGAEPEEIVFTSGGTESNNWVIRSLAENLNGKGHIITSAVEHPSITNPCLHLMNKGFDVTFAGVDENCVVRIEDIEKAIRPDTFLISIMHANNETGAVQPIARIAKLAKKAGVLFHTDAAQSMGKIPVRVDELGVDLMSVAGHKLYAPKGAGLLYVRKGARLDPFMLGGGQENGARAGTENVAFAAALGAACELAVKDMDRQSERIGRLANLLFEFLEEKIEGVILNGSPEFKLPNTLSVSFPGVTGEEMLAAVPGVCASTGAACHDRAATISHVLAAMGVHKLQALGTVRLSLGRHSQQKDIEKAAKLFAAAHERLTRA